MLVSPTINSVHGRLRSITGTDPAADTEISETVPARRRWKIHAIRFSLATDAGGAARTVRLSITDGTNVLFFCQLSSTQAESLEYFYHFAAYRPPEVAVLTTVVYPLPELTLPAGAVFETVTTGLAAGDNYSAPQYLIEEWIDP